MDKKIIKGLIDEKLEVLQEQFSIIREYEGKIPIIELDLYMTSIRDLYELVLSLQLENMGMIMSKPDAQPETPKVAPPPAAPESPEEEIPEPAVIPVPEVPPAPEPAAPVRLSHNILSMEPVTEEEPPKVSLPVEKVEPVSSQPPVTSFQSPVPEPPAPEPVIPPSPAREQVEDRDQPHEKYQRITFDLFSEGGTSLADRYRDGQEKRIADKLQENKIEDLRTSIGINDKFLFINELFEGDMRIYDEAIQKLNSSTTMAQADMQLLDLKIVYNWDSESPTVKKFVELVRRKF